MISVAGEDIAEAAHCVFVEGDDLIARIRRFVGDHLDAQLELAEAEVHVGGFVALVVGSDLRAGIDGQTQIDGRSLIGADVQTAQRACQF